jgi:hypothetical protein
VSSPQSCYQDCEHLSWSLTVAQRLISSNASGLLLNRTPFVVHQPSGLRFATGPPNLRWVSSALRLGCSFRVHRLKVAHFVSEMNSSHRVLGPIQRQCGESTIRGFCFPLRSVRDLSQILDGLLLSAVSRLISSYKHSLGSHLQGFSLPGSRTMFPWPLPS